MNLKNYTSGISVDTTISRIESKLAAAGALGIAKQYDTRRQVSCLVFQWQLDDRRTVSIRLPANTEACFNAMWKEHCLHHSRPRESTKATLREQAARTAWKLVQDWVDVQISMVVMQQAEFLQVFLPYILDGNQTVFERLKGSGYKALAEHT